MPETGSWVRPIPLLESTLPQPRSLWFHPCCWRYTSLYSVWVGETIPQARQPISHRKIRVNNEMGNITRSKVSRGGPGIVTTDSKAWKIRRSIWCTASKGG
uniref:Ribosomal protein S4 n=1 Tax=Picea glauca TaxID=3330 RepID=A0A117NJF5_PICGL|nr:ribosomal protein S4 [Picea glauca]QHR88262.1 putative ribosomal protein S4 [Picea sitchensis]